VYCCLLCVASSEGPWPPTLRICCSALPSFFFNLFFFVETKKQVDIVLRSKQANTGSECTGEHSKRSRHSPAVVASLERFGTNEK
jgi:hypothetical protein